MPTNRWTVVSFELSVSAIPLTLLIGPLTEGG